MDAEKLAFFKKLLLEKRREVQERIEHLREVAMERFLPPPVIIPVIPSIWRTRELMPWKEKKHFSFYPVRRNFFNKSSGL